MHDDDERNLASKSILCTRQWAERLVCAGKQLEDDRHFNFGFVEMPKDHSPGSFFSAKYPSQFHATIDIVSMKVLLAVCLTAIDAAGGSSFFFPPFFWHAVVTN